MAFRVLTLKQAEDDIAEAFDYIVASGTPNAAERWYRNIKAQIESLADMPRRCATAPEASKLGYELRQLLYGKRTGVYRIVFRVLDEVSEVHVLAVRHCARKELTPDDID